MLLFVLNTLLNVTVSSMALDILHQYKGKNITRNIEDKTKDVKVCIWFILNIIVTLINVFLFFCLNINYYILIFSFILGILNNNLAWDLTNRTDNEDIISNSYIIFKREFFILSTILSFIIFLHII